MTLYLRTKPRGSFLLWILLALSSASLLLMLIIHTNDVSYRNRPIDLLRDEKYLELPSDDSLGNRQVFRYNKSLPIVFIGGMPRSGTTLLRAILDAHPDIRCGGETRVIPRILSLRNNMFNMPYEARRLKEAGVESTVFDHAVAEFMLEIIVRHGPPAKQLCNKDPFTLKSAVYIKSLFPNARFLFMIRDGRAVAHSIVSRKVTISGFNITSYRDCIVKWNGAIANMHNQCESLGIGVCLPIYYEKLVMHPEDTTRKILNFLKLPWNDSVLHHDRYIGTDETDKIVLSKLERSTDQVVKPVNTEALSSWIGHIPRDVMNDMPTIAPMLEKLGYDPYAEKPDYGQPDAFVVKNMQILKEHEADWQRRELSLIKQREDLRKKLIASQRRNKKASSSSSSTQSLESVPVEDASLS